MSDDKDEEVGRTWQDVVHGLIQGLIVICIVITVAKCYAGTI